MYKKEEEEEGGKKGERGDGYCIGGEEKAIVNTFLIQVCIQ